MSRADRLVELLDERELDCLLVTDLVNVRYLAGFTGSNGACVVGRDERLFFTDFRYVEQSGAEVRDFEVVQAGRDMLGDLAGRLRGRTGFDDAHLSVSAHAGLREKLGAGVELVPAGGLVERVRFMEDRGADGASFEPIVAAGGHGARPHAQPRDVEIPRDALVVIDMGARVDGYCSDCTRTFATGSLADDALAVYELVRDAQAAALAAAQPGAACREVDAISRDPIEAAGHGERYGHGLGHGVGLEVHEEPRLGKTAEGELEAGNAVTIEPGVYVPGEFGVRIEDLVVVADGRPDVLTGFTKELVTIT